MSDLIQNVHKTEEYFLWALSKEIWEDRGVMAFAPAIRSPNLNFALQTGDFEGDLKGIIQDVEMFYERLHLPWGWIINPIRDQSDLKIIFERHGYALISNNPVFVRSLEDSFSENVLKNFDVREVTEGKISEWILPLKEAFESTETDALLYLETHLRALKKKANFRHFVLYIEGEPVSAATLSYSKYGARLDDLGTKPAWHRQGLGKAVTVYAMKFAKQLGYPWICLEASDQGTFLYEGLGFKALYRNEIYGKKKGDK